MPERARSDAVCVSDVLVINRASEAVILVRGSINQQLRLCKGRRQPTDDIAMRLSSGSVIADSLNAQAVPCFHYGMAVSVLRGRLDSVRKAK